MLTAVRYVIHPGFVVSRTDLDRHYIGAGQLRELYRVPRDARVVVVRPFEPGYREQPGDVHLRPRFDGDYRPVEP